MRYHSKSMFLTCPLLLLQALSRIFLLVKPSNHYSSVENAILHRPAFDLEKFNKIPSLKKRLHRMTITLSKELSNNPSELAILPATNINYFNTAWFQVLPSIRGFAAMSS